MPSTREPSPEPLWRNPKHEEYLTEQIHAQGYHYPPEHSVDFRWNRNLADYAQMPAMMLVAPGHPMFVPGQTVPFPMGSSGVMPLPGPSQSLAHMPSGMPRVETEPARLQPARPSVAVRPAPVPAPDPEKKAPPKQKSKATRGKGQSPFDRMSANDKEKLCKYIYEFMMEKEFISPEGYLFVDVYGEVCNELKDSLELKLLTSEVAQQRFCDLVRSAPQYFKIFRRSIKVTNQCGWFARKGEKMIRLNLMEEK
jgi:hypothetical protein